MKKQILKVAMLEFVLVLTIAACILPMSAEEYKTGDMNGDGAVNSDDAIYLLRHTLSSGKYPLACNHNLMQYDGKVATCVEAGWKAYEACLMCGYSTYESVDALGHNEIFHDAKEATCTESGWGSYVTCSNCDYSTYEEIEAQGHDEKTFEAKSPTCTEIGWNAHVKCSNCDYSTYTELKALGHDYEKGKCVMCGEKDPDYFSSGLDFITNGDGTCYVNGIGNCTDTDLYIPTISPKGDVVTSIASGAFWDCNTLTSVMVPDSVTKIGAAAFYGCSSLESMVLPFVGHSVTETTADQVTLFGFVFGTTSYTGGVATKQKYNYDSYQTFYIPTTLKSVTITSGNIFYGAFYNCDNLMSVIIGDSVTSVGNYAFYGCDNLISVTIGANVKSIQSSSFSLCDRIVEVINKSTLNISEGSTANGDVAYNALEVHNGKSKIINKDDYLFYVVSDDENYLVMYVGDDIELVLPESYNGQHYQISRYAFSNCSELTSIAIPDSVTGIGNNAFIDCYNLKGVYITDISAWCNIYFANLYSNPLYYAKNLYVNNELVTELVLPDSAQKITSWAFCNCNNLTNVTLPDSIASIGRGAFNGCENLTSVIIGQGIANIENYTFSGCINLTSITIPNGVTSIGSDAFQNCVSLTSITIPDSVTSIGSDAFQNCERLISVILPKGITNINSGTFEGCASLTNITIPNGVTSIGIYAFRYCGNLRSILIPSNVTFIGEYAFDQCYKLVEVINKSNLNISKEPLDMLENGFVAWYAIEVHNGESKIVHKDDYLFYTTADNVNYLFGYTGNRSELVLPENYGGQSYEISRFAFRDCFNIVSVTIPDNVTSVGDGAFSGCENLMTVAIGNGVTSIGDYVFTDCSKLMSVTIGDRVTSIGNHAFYQCKRLVEIINKSRLNITVGSSNNGYVASNALEVHCGDSKIVNNNDYLFYTCDEVNYLIGYVGYDSKLILPKNYNGKSYMIHNYSFENCKGLTTVTIPNVVASIGDFVFSHCDELISVMIPDSVTNIGICAFTGCDSLISITVDENNIMYESIDGNLYTEDKTQLIQYAIGKSNTEFLVPYGVKDIGSGAFLGCESLTSVTMSFSVVNIGASAFSHCKNLKSVRIGDGVKCIGASSFYGCYNLTSVTIPNCVTSIGNQAFYECRNLKSVSIGTGVTSIGRYAFKWCDSLSNVVYKDTSTWYITYDSTNWQNQTGGTQINVTNSSTNANHLQYSNDFRSDGYADYYWYKK